MIVAVPTILFWIFPINLLVRSDQHGSFQGTHHPSRQSTNARRGLIVDFGLQSGLIVQMVWTIASAG
jgi:hypothetical protein